MFTGATDSVERVAMRILHENQGMTFCANTNVFFAGPKRLCNGRPDAAGRGRNQCSFRR